MAETRNLLNNLILEGEKHQAFRVSLVCNDFPSIITDTGLVQSKVVSSRITDAMFSNILGEIFAHSSDFTDFQRQRRTLNITDVGEVDVFGLADLRCINIYYKRGKSLFDIDLDLYFPGKNKKSAAAEQVEEKKGSSNDEIGKEDFSISYSDVFGSDRATVADKKLPNTAPNTGIDTETKIDQPAGTASQGLDASTDDLLSLDFSSKGMNEGSKIITQSSPPLPPAIQPMQQEAASQEDAIVTDMSSMFKKNPATSKPPELPAPPTPPLPSAHEEKDDNEEAMDFAVSKSSAAVVEQGDTSQFDNLLREMLRLGASDLHIVFDKHLAFRVNGTIKRVDNIISTAQAKTWLNSLAPKRGGKSRYHVHGLIPAQVFMHELHGGKRFRVNAFKDINGINFAVRSVVNGNCDELNIPPVVRKFCGLSKGLVLLTGYASSGISSTLTALIELVNSVNSCNLLKIGNPVSEFKHATREAIVRQVEVGTHVESMDEALRLSMQSDFDGLFIDDLELSSLPTLLDCIDRGQLAFATMHTKAGASVLEHLGTSLKHQGKLYTSIRAIVGQALVPSVEGTLVAAFEVLVIDGAVIKMLMENKESMLPAYMEANANKGNITLNSSLVNLVIKGKTSYRAAMAASTDKRDFYRTAIKHGIKAAA